jgi:hypothetical protein
LIGLADLLGEFVNLAIRLGLILIAFDDADNPFVRPPSTWQDPVVDPAHTGAWSK